ncbi:MAG: transposase [Methanobrevibacter sp.]|nr:transposase [Candidatus Methanovirga basalitermitum]
MCYFAEKVVKEVDFSKYDDKFKDRPSCKAYPRAVLCKIVVMAFTDSITSSRKISRLVEENIVYMYLAGGYKPKYHTISVLKRLDSLTKNIKSSSSF